MSFNEANTVRDGTRDYLRKNRLDLHLAKRSAKR